ncbi:zinc finger protein RFP-like [Anolis sagrei]|uniref:zinc finger protein RFP-like n=1 Tax=Anolis sagrei TaxID=38937 RepID=UPI00351FE93C
MAGVSGGSVQDLCEEATCSICLDYFRDPVTLAECGHNFCRTCLGHCWGDLEKEAFCPQCRVTLRSRDVIPNRPLANFVEITKKLSLQEPRGKGAMVGVCVEHQEPFKFFCKEHQRPICVVCDRAKEHREHTVIPLQEAAQEYQDQICNCLKNLKEDKEKFLASKAAIEKESQDMLNETEVEREKVMSAFRELHHFLEDQEKRLLVQMEEIEKEIRRKREEHLARFSREISFLGSLIQEVEEKRHQEASEFLQDIGRILKKTEKRRTFCSVVFIPSAMKLKISDMRDMNPFLEDVLKKCKDLFLERKRMEEVAGNMAEFQSESTGIRAHPQFPRSWEDVLLSGPPPKKVNVTLDPDTAFPRLILSEDLKSVRWDKKYQDLPENPGRFNLSSFVLGREEFSAGRFFWDVSVGSEERWAVGVARKSIRRKGPVIISPESGIYAVEKSEGEYKACIPPQNPLLNLNEKLRRIRVFLSCGENQVAFYNADTVDFLYGFDDVCFGGEPILPFFRVFLEGHLRISP